ncbi:hypothetical protein D3C83_49990 [compost metagenome]
MPRQQTVAVIAGVAQQRRPGNRLHPGLVTEVSKHVEAGGAGLHFLQRHDVRIKLRKNAHDTLGDDVTVVAEAAVNVV